MGDDELLAIATPTTELRLEYTAGGAITGKYVSHDDATIVIEVDGKPVEVNRGTLGPITAEIILR